MSENRCRNVNVGISISEILGCRNINVGNIEVSEHQCRKYWVVGISMSEYDDGGCRDLWFGMSGSVCLVRYVWFVMSVCLVRYVWFGMCVCACIVRVCVCASMCVCLSVCLSVWFGLSGSVCLLGVRSPRFGAHIFGVPPMASPPWVPIWVARLLGFPPGFPFWGAHHGNPKIMFP